MGYILAGATTATAKRRNAARWGTRRWMRSPSRASWSSAAAQSTSSTARWQSPRESGLPVPALGGRQRGDGWRQRQAGERARVAAWQRLMQCPAVRNPTMCCRRCCCCCCSALAKRVPPLRLLPCPAGACRTCSTVCSSTSTTRTSSSCKAASQRCGEWGARPGLPLPAASPLARRLQALPQSWPPTAAALARRLRPPPTLNRCST